MPNRILRDWTDSENIDQLDVNTERFFTRLIMKVDDYGRYSANVKLLKSHLFPLKSDIRETDIARWLTACEKSGLIALYVIANKEYLQIDNFKQVLRQKVEKYPAPVYCNEDDTQMLSRRISDVVPETKRNEVEKKPEVEVEIGEPPKHTPDEILFFKNFQDFIKNDAANVGKMKEPFTIEEYLKLKEKFTSKQIKDLILNMGNSKPLLSKNISAYRTFLNWMARDYNTEAPKNEITNGISINDRLKAATQNRA